MPRILLGSGVQRFINFLGMDYYGLFWRGRYYAYNGEWTLVWSGCCKRLCILSIGPLLGLSKSGPTAPLDPWQKILDSEASRLHL